MRFASPHFLWLLLVFPPGLLVFFGWSWRQRKVLRQQFIQARLLPNLIFGLSPLRQKFRLGCLVAAVAGVIVALARPQWGFSWEEIKQRGLDIVVAIDTSKSMLARDIAPNRLARAKLATLDLMRLAKSDRLGLVAFAGTAFLQCPLTIDDTTFRQSLDLLGVTLLPQGGTALAEAIDTALTAFKEENNYKVLVLLTDGEDHGSGALEAAERAAQAGLRIFTIGLGTPEGELLRVQDDKGQEDYVRDEQGNVVKSRLHETLLQHIAGATEGGFYLPLRGAKVMEMLYERGLAPLPKSEGKEKFVRRYHERYHWPLALALVLLALEMIWPEAKRQARRGWLSDLLRALARQTPAAAALLLAATFDTQASPSSALRDYETGHYGESLKAYQELLRRQGDDPRLRFNAGAAAYRSRQFDEAAGQFGQAATAPDLRLQEHAYYNLGNTLYRAGEAVADPQKKTASWEGAVKQYDRALKLNPNNADAKFNRDFVNKLLEELKQQRQQQDQKDAQQQQPQPQPDPSKQDQQQQHPDESKQDAAQPEQQQAQNQKPHDPPPPQDSQPQQDPQQAKPSPDQRPDNEQPQEQPAQPQPVAAGQMTPEEAKRLLDSQKAEEQLLPFRPDAKAANRQRPLKDW